MTELTDTLPSFFIAGAPKSGTSSMFRWLADHPQAHGSTPKETCFFADQGSHVFQPGFNASCGLDAYRAAFSPVPAGTHLTFEATASYIYSKTALEQIPDLPTRPKCLFILREPAAQILSTYTYARNNWAAIPAEMTFDDFLSALKNRTHDFDGNELVRDALSNANYAPWMVKWRDKLGQDKLGFDRIKVCTFDTLRRDPRAFMTDLALWIGIDPSFYEDYTFAAENQSYAPVNRSLQRLNIALRDRLPKGRLYDATRRLYRRLNTSAPQQGADSASLTRLRLEFATANRQLEAEFDLDLSAWF
jgi:hypothetical protein